MARSQKNAPSLGSGIEVGLIFDAAQPPKLGKNQKNKLQQEEAAYIRNQAHAKLAALESVTVATVDSLGGIISNFMEFQGFWESENTAEKIALMHSELSEALEADRKDQQAEHIFGFSGVEEELADVVIRILDFANYNGLRLGEAIIAKMHVNLNRERMHGKKY
jgi:NTP pyrophosphatase (non-canonical NTP hydrolase)